MANFNADILLQVNSGPAERQVKKLERSIAKVEDATRGILEVDKKIILERKALLKLNGRQAVVSKKRIQALGLQKAELALQKRELAQIVRLEKQRAATNKRVTGPSASGAASAGAGIGVVASGSSIAAAAGLKTAGKELKGAASVLDGALTKVVANLEKSNVAAGRFKEGLQESKSTSRQLALINGQIEKNYESINAKARQFKAELGNIARIDAYKRRLTQGENIEREKSVQKARALQTELKKAVKEQDKLGDSAAEYNKRAGQVSGRFRAPGLPKTPTAASGSSVAGSAALGGAAGGLGTKLVGLAAAYIGVDRAARLATASIQKSINAASSQQRISALADGFDAYELVLNKANIAAEKFNISQIEANNQFAQLYGRLRPLGLTLDEVSTVFEGFNTAAALTGATAAESSGALLQLSQALGAGALRGEEFNSIAEQAPAVLQAIAKEVDKPVGQLKQLAKDGKLTSDIVVAALKRVKTEGADKLAAALDTPAQKVKKLENRFEDLQIALGNLTLPATIGLIDQLTTAVETSTGKIDTYTRAFEKLLSPLGAVNIQSGKFLEFIGKLPGEIAKSLPGIGGLIRGLEAIDFLLSGIAGEKPEVLLPPAGDDPIVPLIKRLGIDPPTGGDDTISGGRSAADITAEQLEQGKRLSKEFSRQVALLSARSDIERESYQIAFDRQDREEAIAEALDSQKDSLLVISDRIAALEKIELVTDDALTKTGDYIDLLKEGMEGLAGDVTDDFAEFNSQAKPLEETLNGIGGILRTGVVDAISLAVTETDKLGESFQALAADILQAISKALILSAITTAIKGLGGGDGVGFFSMLSSGLGARESGGPVNANAPYVVGEAGPELFIPGQSGTVVAADQFDAAKEALSAETETVSAFAVARASMEKGNTTRAMNYTEKKEKAEETATELAEAASRSTSIVRFETYRVGEMDVVTKEEAMRIGQQSAKQAEANVYRGLKNRPARRAKAGI